MANPFPGMNPFLEDPAIWEGFHLALIMESMYQLSKRLPPTYIANVQEWVQSISISDEAARIYVPDVAVAREKDEAPFQGHGGTAVLSRPVTIPSTEDLEIREGYIEILRLPDYELVSSIELLSPSNKLGEGLGVYREKRRALVARGVHVVEIDLLFRGARTKLSKPLPPGDYYVMTFRADRRPDVDVYSWKLRDPLPQIPIPLKGPGESVNLDLGGALESAFERADYDRKLKYRSPLPMALGISDAQWVEEMLRKAGKRTA